MGGQRSCGSRRPPSMPSTQGSAEAFAEARAEALKNRQQNGRLGNTDLIGGGYLNFRDDGVGKSKSQMTHSGLQFIMPSGAAQMKMQFDGVSIAGACESAKAYYNAATMREEARLATSSSCCWAEMPAFSTLISNFTCMHVPYMK